MNKDKFQTSPQPLQTSSTTLTLQQLNKNTERGEAAAESMRSYCKDCFKETSPNRKCGGHGAGGGGGGGSGSGSQSEEKASQGDGKSLTSKPDQSLDTDGQLSSESGSLGTGDSPASESQVDENSFDPDIIADLVDKELLVISNDTNDRLEKTLSINLLCEPDLLTQVQRHELKKFMSAILKELKEFKEEHQISEDCVNIIQDEKGNIISLQISLPSLALQNAFIQRLTENLLPTTDLKKQKAQSSAPTPLSTEPKPSNYKKDKEEDPEIYGKAKEDGELETFNPSPFSTKVTPW
ncbi:MAG: hypothetical protein H0T84_15480 [Tatlockia sp.]|nr:hypothetical protein [Tatlockia sp.]